MANVKFCESSDEIFVGEGDGARANESFRMRVRRDLHIECEGREPEMRALEHPDLPVNKYNVILNRTFFKRKVRRELLVRYSWQRNVLHVPLAVKRTAGDYRYGIIGSTYLRSLKSRDSTGELRALSNMYECFSETRNWTFDVFLLLY